MSFLPALDTEYLVAKGIPYEEIETSGHRALIFKGFRTPIGRYDASTVDVLVLLPPSYNDAGPDMFYTLPWLRLIPEKRYAKAADVQFEFDGQIWQRWSRHADGNYWRPGVDGIRTVLKRISAAMETAEP